MKRRKAEKKSRGDKDIIATVINEDWTKKIDENILNVKKRRRRKKKMEGKNTIRSYTGQRNTGKICWTKEIKLEI